MLKSIAIVLALGLVCAGLLTFDQPAVHASMIGGLASLESISKEQMEAMPEPVGTVMLTLDGVQLPYDPASNTYFIPQSPDTAHFEGKLQLEMTPGYSYCVYPGADVSKQHALEKSIGYHIYGVRGDQCVYSKVIFTALPVLCLRTLDGELPGDDAQAGMLALFEISNGRLEVKQSRMNINLRGNTSKRLPKKSYRVTLLHEDGENRSLSLAGLREDDDWILNPMYSDKSKIREWLAYSLWDEMNSSGLNAQSSRITYAELFLNGEYWGLYGLQERVDRKQVNADKRSGVLYKVIANDRPTAQELLDCEETEQCRAFKLEHAGAGVQDSWMPAASLMQFLDEGEFAEKAALDMNNVIDYGLWIMFTQSHDCHFKNQFLNCVYEDGAYTMYKIPWDLNNTFGDVWSSDQPETNHIEFYIGSLIKDSAFGAMLDQNDPAFHVSVLQRWQELRGETLEYNRLVEKIRSMHTALRPAIIRDGRRWPESGSGTGNAENTRDIEAYLFTILFRMDEYIAGLET